MRFGGIPYKEVIRMYYKKTHFSPFFPLHDIVSNLPKTEINSISFVSYLLSTYLKAFTR